MALAESPSISAVRKADVGDATLRQCLREDGSGSDSRTREFGELAVAKCRERAPGRLFRTSRRLRHTSSIAGLLIPGASSAHYTRDISTKDESAESPTSGART